MKKVVRLTESDLIRIVKRIIKEQEDWSDDNETEYLSSQSRFRDNANRLERKSKDINLRHSKNGKIDYSDEYYDEIEQLMDDPDFMDSERKYDDLYLKRNKSLAKGKYDRLVKNRPSDFDVDSARSEFDSLDSEIRGFESEYPRLQGQDYDDFYDKFNEFTASDKYKQMQSKKDRRDYLNKQLGKDRYKK